MKRSEVLRCLEEATEVAHRARVADIERLDPDLAQRCRDATTFLSDFHNRALEKVAAVLSGPPLSRGAVSVLKRSEVIRCLEEATEVAHRARVADIERRDPDLAQRCRDSWDS